MCAGAVHGAPGGGEGQGCSVEPLGENIEGGLVPGAVRMNHSRGGGVDGGGSP